MKLATFLAGFFRQGTAESSTRLAGIATTFGAIVFAFVNPGETASIAAMFGASFSFFFSRKSPSAPAAPAAPFDFKGPERSS